MLELALLLFKIGSHARISGAQNKTAKSQDSAALDELPCNQSHEALFSVTQI